MISIVSKSSYGKTYYTSIALLLSILLVSCKANTFQNDLESDIDFLIETLPQKHPNLFFELSQEEFEQTFLGVKELAGERTEFELIMALREATAKIGDPHTNFGFYEAIETQGYFPFDVLFFSDGLYILGAEPSYASALGKKIQAINGVDIEQVIENVLRVVPENAPYFAQKRLPHFSLLMVYTSTTGLHRVILLFLNYCLSKEM